MILLLIEFSTKKHLKKVFMKKLDRKLSNPVLMVSMELSSAMDRLRQVKPIHVLVLVSAINNNVEYYHA